MVTEAELPAIRSMAELFQRTAAAHGDEVALRPSTGGSDLTWSQYADRVERIAGGLAALGVSRGDTVALLMTNRPEFHLVDAAALHLGAVPYSVYNTSSPEQMSHLFKSAGNRVVVTESRRVAEVRAAGGEVQHVVTVDEGAEDAVLLVDLERERPEGFDFTAAWRAVGADDLLTIIYTSGTTGPPKGVEITHGAMLETLRSAMTLPFIRQGAVRGRLLSYLPDAHVANRFFSHYLAMVGGASITTVAELKTVATVLPAVRPTVFLGVPALWYKIQALISHGVATQTGLRRRLGRWALSVGEHVVRLETSDRRVPAHLGVRHALADRLVLRRLRERLGLDQATATITGAAPIAADSVRFFLALGIQLCEGWAMSESSAAGAINRPGSIRPGTVGPSMPGVEVRLAGDGELLLRTPALMRGYRGEPAMTAEAVDVEGWLHTGDVGTVDEQGYITIVDRKKELMINEAGKNMSPANIEKTVLSACPLVASVVAIGDRRPYVVALVTLDHDALRAFAAARDLPTDDLAALSQHSAVRHTVDDGITRANARLSRVEQIKTFRVLPHPWTPGGVELTPTQKLRRKAIAGAYAAEIDALYAGHRQEP